MSSRPGLTLEAYLAWAYNLVVEDEPENNTSLGIAEFLGTATHRRPVITKEQFAPIVAKFEEYREQVEDKLLDFDEDNQSWRDYAGYNFDFLPDIDKEIFDYIKTLTEQKEHVVNQTNKEYITKETIALLFPFVMGQSATRNLIDAVSLINAQLSDEHENSAMLKARINTILQAANNALPSGISILTGNGQLARYLKEHVAVHQFLAFDKIEADKLNIVLEEIDRKFNLKPSVRMDSVEWQNIVKLLIDLDNKLTNNEYPEEMFVQTDIHTPIINSGFYSHDSQKAVYFVFGMNGLTFTIVLTQGQQPYFTVFHEWEQTHVPFYGLCYFPGMYAALTGELERITAKKEDEVVS